MNYDRKERNGQPRHVSDVLTSFLKIKMQQLDELENQKTKHRELADKKPVKLYERGC